MQHFVSWLESEGITVGWAFRKPNRKYAEAADYWQDIFGKLEDIQAQGDGMIEPDIDVWDTYGIQRSGHRFFDTEWQNKQVI